ncbi:MAG: hypothetical protein WCC57_15925 [Paracoccaceae bacterium]
MCGAVPGDDDCQSGAIDADGGTLYVNVFALQHGPKDVNGKNVTGWDWSQWDSYDLASGTRLSSLTTIDIKHVEGGLWVSELCGAAQEPGHVSATIAIEHPEVLGRSDVTYHIYILDAATGGGMILTDLRAVFL